MITRSPTILQIVPELETGGAELSAIEMASAITTAGGRALVVSQGGRMEGALAAAGGEPDVVELLLARGADVAARDGRGSTAADTAMANGHEDLAEHLRALEAIDKG